MMLMKTVGLAALAALAAMALVGATSAFAKSTALCTTDEDPCDGPGTVITHVHVVDSAALLLNNVTGYVKCVALFLGNVLSGLANPLHFVGNFTYSSCIDEAGRHCLAIEASSTSLITVLKTATEKGVVLGEGEVLVRCGFFIHCWYNGFGLEGTAEGPLQAGGNGVVKLHEQTVNRVKGFCPETSKLDILLTPLTATYISS